MKRTAQGTLEQDPKTLKETCKPRRTSRGYRQDNPKEGRKEGREEWQQEPRQQERRHEQQGKTDIRWELQDEKQNDKNKANKRDRNERRTWDETVKWRGWKDLEYKRRKHTKRCNGNSKRKNRSRIMRRQQGTMLRKKRRFNGNCKGVKRKNGWIEN